jgi:hypothetical protein
VELEEERIIMLELMAREYCVRGEGGGIQAVVDSQQLW